MIRLDRKFRPGERVLARQHDWDAGVIALTGAVIRYTSPTHLIIRCDDGLIICAPEALCERLVEQNEEEAA